MAATYHPTPPGSRRSEPGAFETMVKTMSKTWSDWIDEFDFDSYEPTVYSGNSEIEQPLDTLYEPTHEQLLAEIDPEPLPEDGEHQGAEAWCAIANAFDAILQRQQSDIDEITEQAELDQWIAKERELDALRNLVSESLGITRWDFASTGSCYAWWRGVLKIRVSDHKQVPGGGWCHQKHGRMGEADADFHLVDGHHEWTRETVRQCVANAWKEERSCV